MSSEDVKAEITGRVWKILRPLGAKVVEGEEIMIVESMKMEIPVLAPADGVLSELIVVEGDDVAEGQVVARIAQ